jgi:HSP20 family protein
MQLVRHNPWELMHTLSRDVDRLFQVDSEQAGRFVPAIDIHEEAERYVIHADLPGIDASQIDITVDGDLLKLKGERQLVAAAEDAKTHRAERAAGRFERHFRLPESASAEGVEAEYRHGVLTVSIPKVKAPEPYRIRVTAN